MRVLYVDLEREWRGGQSQALLTLKGLRNHGHLVELLAARESPIATRSSETGLKVYVVPRLGLRGWAAATISNLVKKNEFALVHLNEPHALTAAWLARAQKQLPLLLSRRIGFPLRKGIVSRSRYRAVTRFVANSKEVAQSLLDSGITEERISIVNEGVEILPLPTAEQRASARKRWGFRDEDFVFGCLSVFVPEKGQRHLIEALPQVRSKHPQVRLFLAGEGACRPQMESLSKRLGQTEAVLFPGFVKEVQEAYAALDAFAFPSEFEGLGTALQAAMAVGLPCVSTRRGALGEVVEEGRTALVAEPNAEEFATAMLKIVEDEALRKSLGKAGRAEVEQRFSAALMVERTLRVYEDVLKKKAGQKW